jgi:hypothetical protein
MDDDKKCQKCEGEGSEEWHPCPFREELDDDHETLCNCCVTCTENCALDI